MKDGALSCTLLYVLWYQPFCDYLIHLFGTVYFSVTIVALLQHVVMPLI